jgi:hypothetical protein
VVIVAVAFGVTTFFVKPAPPKKIPTPLAYAENLYFFREHVDVVRRRIVRRLSNESATPGPAAVPMRASEGGS